MNNIAKVLIGVGVVGAVAVTATVVAKKSEKQMIELKHTDDGAQVVEEPKKETVIDRVKTYAMKKSIKFLAWVLLHKDQIEAVATVLTVVSGIISVVVNVRDFMKGYEIQKKLNSLQKQMDVCTNHLGHYIEGQTTAIIKNQHIIDQDVIKVGEKLGIQMLNAASEATT